MQTRKCLIQVLFCQSQQDLPFLSEEKLEPVLKVYTQSADHRRSQPDLHKHGQSKSQASTRTSSDVNRKYFEISPYADRRGEKPKPPGKIAFRHVDTEKENVYEKNIRNSTIEDGLARSSTYTKEEQRSLTSRKEEKNTLSKVTKNSYFFLILTINVFSVTRRRRKKKEKC